MRSGATAARSAIEPSPTYPAPVSNTAAAPSSVRPTPSTPGTYGVLGGPA